MPFGTWVRSELAGLKTVIAPRWRLRPTIFGLAMRHARTVLQSVADMPREKLLRASARETTLQPPRQADLSSGSTDPAPASGSDPSSWRAISLEAYARTEAAALPTLSIPSLMAFQPATFQSVGFPVQVCSDGELVRYADHNFEGETAQMYRPDAEFAPIGFVNRFTPAEAGLATRLRDTVAHMTRERFGRAVRPMTNLMVQFGPFRSIEALSQTYGRKLAVFEPGPGAGYLGALLAQAGYTYASYDVTQSLYLWQSHLLDAATAGTFRELAFPETQHDDDRLAVLHMPWWLFAHQMDATPLRYDLVYSNSNLGEMTLVAFRQLLLFAKVALQDSEVAAFTFFSTGMTRFNTLESIDADMKAFGFQHVMSAPFHCYQLEGRDPEPIRAAFAGGIPHIGGSRDTATLDANTVFATPRSEAPLDVQLTQWFHGWPAPLTDD